MVDEDSKKQLLHLVFGGELKTLGGNEFRDLDGLDIVGIFPDYNRPRRAWKAKAQASVDNAHMRYFVVHLHRLLEPDATRPADADAMEQNDVTAAATRKAASAAARRRHASRLWRRIRKPLAQSRFVKGVMAALFAQACASSADQPAVEGSADLARSYERTAPGIIALWHGQHLLTPGFYPRGAGCVAMVSRSADAELNALVVEKFGFEAVRGSGGRDSASMSTRAGRGR